MTMRHRARKQKRTQALLTQHEQEFVKEAAELHELLAQMPPVGTDADFARAPGKDSRQVGAPRPD